MTHAIRVGIDWGSSSFRAYHFNDNGAVIDRIEQSLGIKNISDNNFEAALYTTVGHWLQPGDSLLLSGMITSVNGWHETPYLECPLTIDRIGDRLTTVNCREHTLLFLPGVCQRQPRCDVMRGEELQLIGAAPAEASITVLPGTHSKWAMIEGSNISHFITIPTGELYELLLTQSLIGQLAEHGQWSNDGFEAGVLTGYHTNGLIGELFNCRAGKLLNQFTADYIPAHLSGLLIGNEIKTALSTSHNELPVRLIGNAKLTTLYHQALGYVGIDAMQFDDDAAALGFATLIRSLKARQ